MKVEYVQIWKDWFWYCGNARSAEGYTRRQDAVRGFERFCAQVRAM